MQSSQATVGIYLVWALSLFLIAGGANSITAYYLEYNKQWNRSVFNILQHDIYFCIVLFQLLYPRTQEAKKDRKCSNSITLEHKTSVMAPITVAVFLLFTAVCIAHTLGVVASWMVNYSYPSKVVADYMMDHANSRSSGGDSQAHFGPANSMRGCKYMVNWPCLQGNP